MIMKWKKAKRIAFIGLSSPLCYVEPLSASSNHESANPLLESAFGLSLLFDEIWFVCRDVCPRNMQTLPYVRFLREQRRLPNLEGILSIRWRDYLGDNARFIPYYESTLRLAQLKYSEALDRIGRDRQMSFSPWRRLKHRGLGLYASSVNVGNLVLDMIIMERLRDRRLELITNSFTDCWLRQNSSLFRMTLADVLTIEDIPNFASLEGSYHPSMEEIRENPYLRDFRRWIATQSGDLDPRVIQDIGMEVKQVIIEAEHRLFLRLFDPASLYRTTALTALGAVMDLAIPFAGTLGRTTSDVLKYQRLKNDRWQAFLVSTWLSRMNANRSSSTRRPS